MSTLPVWAHELVVAPGALGLAFVHARRALGTASAALELTVLAIYGFSFELAAIRLLSSHDYGPRWTAAPLGVPVAVAVVWAAVISSAMALAPRLGGRSALGRGAAAALIAILLDLAVEPVAVGAGLWTWTPPGPWLGIPIGNFVGWALVVGAYTACAESWRQEDLRTAVGRRVAVAAASIALLLVVGAAWTAWRAEELFGGASGWLVWAMLLATGAAVGIRATWAGPSTQRPATADGAGGGLTSRLAAPPATLPVGTFLFLAAAFAVEAVLLARVDVALVVSSSILLLAVLGRTASSGR